MSGPVVAPYGCWKSPITSDLIVAGTIGLGAVVLDGDDIYWTEMRPKEAGRYVIVRRTPDGQIADVTPPGFNARTRVHEYGGGAFLVADGVVYFANFSDQRLYRQASGAPPEPITPAVDLRYADGVFDRQHNRVIAVREDHTTADKEAVNAVVSVDATGRAADMILASGHDFYAYPRLSPDGRRLAWMAWDHPNMPWDGTELWVAERNADGTLGPAEPVAGGSRESIFQPEWSPDGTLHFVSDRTGWWNLYRWRAGRTEPLCPRAAEFGLPLWWLGVTTYGFESERSLLCTFIEDGKDQLARLDTGTGNMMPIPLQYTSVDGLRVGAGVAAFIGVSPTQPAAVVRLDLATGAPQELRRASSVSVDPGYISIPETITFPTEGGETAHGFDYAPRNQDHVAPAGERPPLLVKSHGGPTGATSTNFNLGIQYFTSRGFAVLDVDYRGSTGYGLAYRDRLQGQWGIVDVDDCANGAKHLVAQGKADPNRLAISGGSAGGYTTLAALAFRDVFKAGASHYGVSDLGLLVEDTHKFESRYLDNLIGPYPARKDLYQARSPIYAVDRLSCPVIFFQGDEDKVVPPNQAERMVDALKAKGLPVAYVLFKGEQHGFRQAPNIKRALDGEFYFYSRVFGFEMAEAVEPVVIENAN